MKNSKAILLPVLAFVVAACSENATEAVLENQTASDEAFVEQLQPRDSILIADQLRYGCNLDGIPFGSVIELPRVGDTLGRYIEVIRPWELDTLKVSRRDSCVNLQASIVVTSFEEGEYLLPGIPVAIHRPDGSTDTLLFKGSDVLFCTIPVDTATFTIHDIRGQISYPVTFTEILPWAGGAVALAALVLLAVILWKRHRRKVEEALRHDPPHIVALRKLDAYRGDKFWAPAKQKLFYSGVTDALREYMCARYGISAMEMTTAEIFRSLKHSDLDESLKDELKELFERSDFVKFAKYVASDQENAGVLPLGVRFVTTTYQEDINEEVKEEGDVI